MQIKQLKISKVKHNLKNKNFNFVHRSLVDLLLQHMLKKPLWRTKLTFATRKKEVSQKTKKACPSRVL